MGLCVVEELPARETAHTAAQAITSYEANLARAAAIVSRMKTAAVAEENEIGAIALGRLECGAELFEFPDRSPEQIIAWLRTKHPDSAFLIDIWGPWCAPCVNALPAHKRVLRQLAGEPIVAVYLASRVDTTTWKQAVARHELAGINIRLSDTQTAGCLDLFSGAGFPSYGLVARSGEIVPNGETAEWLHASTIEALARAVRSGEDSDEQRVSTD